MVGNLIVIEGADGAGKETQARLLVRALKEQGAAYFDFPRYTDSLGGQLTKQALRGDFGNFRDMHPRIASLPYIIDRVGARGDIISALNSGDVVCNRYTPSNAIFQAAKLSSDADRAEFILWLESLEYDELKLPRPDLVVYLYVPFKFSQQLMHRRIEEDLAKGIHRTLDQHESDNTYLRSVIDLYLDTASIREGWEVVSCVVDDQLLSREAIHEKVLALVKQLV